MAQPISRITETREQWLGRAIEMMRPEFAAAGAPLPENISVSCSWPSGNPRMVIGKCWVAEASSRCYVEVFINPVLDQVAGLQGVLVTLRHELVHAAGRRGHGREFKALAVELGLTGPMTATAASPDLLDFINWTLLPQLSQYPHGAITGRGEIVVPPTELGDKWTLLPQLGKYLTWCDHRAGRDPGPPTEAGDKPIILRPDYRPKKQSARMLKAECPGVRLHDPAKQEVGRRGPVHLSNRRRRPGARWRR
jgi:hypothetical protein